MPPLDAIPGSPAELVAAAAVFLAALQLVLARWRDLAPLTVGVSGCALVLDLPVVSRLVGAGVVAALLLSAAAQARGARHGVGRPALLGMTVAVTALGGVLPLWLPEIVPVPEPERLAAVAVVPGALAAVVGGLLALERPGPRARPTRWMGRIPVETPADPSRAG